MYRGTSTLLTLAGVFLTVWLLARFLLPIALPFLLGLALALSAEPLVGLLSRRLPRALGAGIGVSITFCTLALLLGLLCAFVLRELGLLAAILPDLEQTARAGIDLVQLQLLQLADRAPQGLQPMLRSNVTGFFSDGTSLLNRAVEYILGLAGRILTHVPDSALTLGTGIISAFMISAKLPRLRAWLLGRLPREKLRQLKASICRLKSAVGGWLLAQLKLSGVSAVILLLGLTLLRIPYAPLWAVGICLVDAFPILGTGTVLLPWALILFLQQDTARAIGILGIYAVVSVSRSALEPRLVGQQLGLDPLATLASLYAGYRIWGLGGMILAPVLAVAAVQLFKGQGG